MRISDWSSDVCSSDLTFLRLRRCELCRIRPRGNPVIAVQTADFLDQVGFDTQVVAMAWHARHPGIADFGAQTDAETAEQRSEEHTSELQSLMRISYAVFCLKKKNIYNPTINDVT